MIEEEVRNAGCGMNICSTRFAPVSVRIRIVWESSRDEPMIDFDQSSSS